MSEEKWSLRSFFSTKEAQLRRYFLAMGVIVNCEIRQVQLKVTLTLGATRRIVRQRMPRVQLSGIVLNDGL